MLAITGPHQYEAVVEEVHKAVPRPHDPFLDLVPPQGVRLTPRHYAYLKISEGCNNACSFCIIPALRGRLKSRGLSDVLREAERLVAAGVQELLVISQDTSAYGLDLGYAASAWRGRGSRGALPEPRQGARLARRLGAPAICLSLSACRSGRAADGRGARPALSRHSLPAREPESAEGDAPARASGEDARAHRRWRKTCPELAIRSTFIVGFPGETEEDFALLLDWLAEAKLARVGCFKYENVDGAAANALPGHVPEEVKAERYDRLMRHQQAISAELLATRIGKTIEVLVDEVDAEGAIARSHWDAPEIDGNVFLQGETGPKPGDRLRVTVEEASEYDLFARRAEVEASRPALVD